MKEAIKRMWDDQPLTLIILAGLFFRVLAIIFSKGYGMHDDHFYSIEIAQSWVDGYSYDNWIPAMGAREPQGHSLFYPGMHYLLFSYFKWRGVLDPQMKMYVIRTITALWSLFVIIYGFKIAEHYSGKKVARQVGILLALLFFMPFLSVRNLVEMVCIPPMLFATWLMINAENKDKIRPYILMGLWCSVAFSFRFQSAFFVAGLWLVMLFQKKWKPLVIFSLSGAFFVFLIQGVVDMMVWGKPFVEFIAYVNYNIIHKNDFVNGPWYNYLLLVAGILIPPISLFMIFGFLRSWKKYPILFWPTLMFFAFHSSFPNKQERFILPSIPFIIILGLIGWNEFVATSNFWQKNKGLLKGSWVFFWSLNIIALPVISTTYTKRSRVESMYYLSQKKDLKNIMVEESYTDKTEQMPLFYLGDWDIHVVEVTKQINQAQAYYRYKKNNPPSIYPNYAIFFGSDKIDNRVAAFKKIYPDATYLTTIEPSMIDKLMTFLNPINKNQTAYIYHFDQEGMNVPPPQDTIVSGH